MSVHVFGIRHHGPGSARSVLEAFEKLQPDCILIEGPPDADDLLALMVQPTMQPPVALLIYDPDAPKHAAFYPFALFSPEWQALTYGLARNIPTRFMDLPQSYSFALYEEALQEVPVITAEINPPEQTGQTGQAEGGAEVEVAPEQAAVDPIRLDPLRALAEAAGYTDSERWWEHMVEQRLDSEDLFAAILEAMTALRDAAEPLEGMPARYEALREAHMRKTIREAEKAGYQRIAVVCGAWHSPALANMPPAKDDNALLKGLKKVKTKATWVPWTHGRLARVSGYGAGINSPGWYLHLWQTAPERISIEWMSRVARMLRDERLDASTAQVIDAVRLTETLAALRDHHVPGLSEMNEAAQTVICFGRPEPMELIGKKLIIGELMGEVPDDTPTVPLQQDLESQQKRLRLKVEAVERRYELDLRKPNDLEKSHLLHRLLLLNVQWGKVEYNQNKTGTFREVWYLEWKPELAISVIEASIWGNTIRDAAAASAIDRADQADNLPVLTELVSFLLVSDLPEATAHVMKRLETQAALTSDVTLLMQSLPSLVQIARYGNVRKTDSEMVLEVIDGLITRTCIGLPGACASLDDDAAAIMFKLIMDTNSALALLQNAEHLHLWQDTLAAMLEREGLHGLLAGCFNRILLDAGRFDVEEGTRRMRLSLSRVTDPVQAAAWAEGFLSGSGLILLHDDKLWSVIDEWVTTLSGEVFQNLLPLLRRTFSTFSAYERREIGQRVQQGRVHLAAQTDEADDFDLERAEAVLPLVAQLLGMEWK